MSAAERPAETPPGILAENYSEVLGLQSCLARSEPDIALIPRILGRVIREGCWREWLTPEDRVVRWNAADFRLFLTTKRPEGCETPLHVLERILRDTEVWEPYLDLIRGERGNPTGVNQYTGGNRDNVTVSSSASDVIASLPTYPVPPTGVPSQPPGPARNYAREAPTGNSTSYGLRRLSVEAPEAYQQVVSGEKSVNRAMIEAGLRVEEFTIPVEPEKAARRILKRFKGDDLAALIRLLASHAGLEIREPGRNPS